MCGIIKIKIIHLRKYDSRRFYTLRGNYDKSQTYCFMTVTINFMVRLDQGAEAMRLH